MVKIAFNCPQPSSPRDDGGILTWAGPRLGSSFHTFPEAPISRIVILSIQEALFGSPKIHKIKLKSKPNGIMRTNKARLLMEK